MTRRANKPKATQTAAPTINYKAPVSPVESVKAESKARVASKPKQAISTAKKAPRARSKKVVVEKPIPPEGKVVSEVTYVAPNRAILVADKPPSLYSRFKDWLVFKLYYYTSYFRGY